MENKHIYGFRMWVEQCYIHWVTISIGEPTYTWPTWAMMSILTFSSDGHADCRHKERMSKVKTHRWHETLRQMFKHFMGEGHGGRSSLRQSTQNECLPTMKCQFCQSTGEWDLSWHWPCHKVAPVCVELSSCCFKQEQIENTVTDYTVQITIAQIVLVSTW